MANKFKKLSEFDTKTRDELAALESDSYIPTFTVDQENTKINVSELSTELSAGENITINGNRVNAVNTTFTAGRNINITPGSLYDTISYAGDMPTSYIGSNNVKITNNVLTPKIGGNYGSKLNPVTFKDDNTLVNAGYTSDMVFIQSVNRTTDQFIYIDAESIQRRDKNRPAEVGAYYWLNTKTMDYTWNKQNPSGEGLNKVLPILYNNFVIDNTERITGIILTTSFLMGLNEHEIILNFVNRETEELIFLLRNDSGHTINTLAIYEQGRIFTITNWTNNTSKYIVNYLSNGTPTSQLVGVEVSDGIYPPFCGNVVNKNVKDNEKYFKLYSSIRFVVLSDGNSISLMSTVY